MWSSIRPLRRLLSLPLLYTLSYIFSLLNAAEGAGGGDLWPLDRPDGMPSIQSLEVMCGKDHMDVHLTFSQPFEGIVSSKGQHGDPRCVYVPPSTGQTFFSFRIAYARCGTKPDLHGQFYENTVVVQYDKDLLEVWDEAKRLRCEWFNDYEKTASKPPMVIADLDVIQLDFRGDNVDCWMEIQHGKGPWAPPVSGIVPLGSTLTLVVAINDYRGEFDMRVKSCMASDGGGHVIQLSDEFGCVLRPKMISRFLKARGADERASVITYAFFHAFKFPDALSVHIKCKVEICRHGCLDHCQLQPENGVPDLNNHYNVGPLDRKDEKIVDGGGAEEKHRLPDPVVDNEEEEDEEDVVDFVAGDGGKIVDEESLVYDDIIHEETAIKMPLNGNNHHHDGDDDSSELDITALPHKDMLLHDQFPHGPRTFEDNDAPLLPSPRSFSDDINKQSTINTSEKEPTTTTTTTTAAQTTQQQQSTRKRRKRSVVISDRKVRSADVGVSGLYEVISEADLAFSPDNRAEAVTVFQGRIREEVVYGICMPVPGFSVLFVLVAVSAVVSALVAGTLLYRYQLQKEHFAQQQQQHDTTTIPLSLFSGWMGLRLLRTRNNPSTSGQQATNANGTDSSVVVNGKTEQNKRALRDLD